MSMQRNGDNKVKTKQSFFIQNYDGIKTDIKYIGYYDMLDKIVDLMEKTPHKEREKLIDKYIEVLRLINEIEKGGKQCQN